LRVRMEGLTLSRPLIGAYANHAPSPKLQRQVQKFFAQRMVGSDLRIGNRGHAGVHIMQNGGISLITPKTPICTMDGASGWQRHMAAHWLLVRRTRACFSGAPGRR